MTETLTEAPEAQTAPEPAQPAPAPVEVPAPKLPIAVPDATFDELDKKPRRTSSFDVYVPGPDGPVARRMTYQAISGEEYDALQAAHRPTAKNRADGLTYNPDTFAPALISAVSLRPKLSVEQAKRLYTHPDYSVGESSQLYMEAVALCSAGLNVPFTETA